MDIRNTIREILTSTVKTDVVGAAALINLLSPQKWTALTAYQGRVTSISGGYIKIGKWVYLNFMFTPTITINNNQFYGMLGNLPNPETMNGLKNATIIMRATGATSADRHILHGQIVDGGLQVFNNSGAVIDNTYTIRGTIVYLAE